MASRYKANVVVIDKKWGEVFSLDEIKFEIEKNKKIINKCGSALTTQNFFEIRLSSII